MADPVRIIPSEANSGSVFYHGPDGRVELTREDGSSLAPGDLNGGDIVTLDPATGVIIGIRRKP